MVCCDNQIKRGRIESSLVPRQSVPALELFIQGRAAALVLSLLSLPLVLPSLRRTTDDRFGTPKTWPEDDIVMEDVGPTVLARVCESSISLVLVL